MNKTKNQKENRSRSDLLLLSRTLISDSLSKSINLQIHFFSFFSNIKKSNQNQNKPEQNTPKRTIVQQHRVEQKQQKNGKNKQTNNTYHTKTTTTTTTKKKLRINFKEENRKKK